MASYIHHCRYHPVDALAGILNGIGQIAEWASNVHNGYNIRTQDTTTSTTLQIYFNYDQQMYIAAFLALLPHIGGLAFVHIHRRLMLFTSRQCIIELEHRLANSCITNGFAHGRIPHVMPIGPRSQFSTFIIYYRYPSQHGSCSEHLGCPFLTPTHSLGTSCSEHLGLLYYSIGMYWKLSYLERGTPCGDDRQLPIIFHFETICSICCH